MFTRLQFERLACVGGFECNVLFLFILFFNTFLYFRFGSVEALGFGVWGLGLSGCGLFVCVCVEARMCALNVEHGSLVFKSFLFFKFENVSWTLRFFFFLKIYSVRLK